MRMPAWWLRPIFTARDSLRKVVSARETAVKNTFIANLRGMGCHVKKRIDGDAIIIIDGKSDIDYPPDSMISPPWGFWSIRSSSEASQSISPAASLDTIAAGNILVLEDVVAGSGIVQNAYVKINDKEIEFHENAEGTYRISARVQVKLDTSNSEIEDLEANPAITKWATAFKCARLRFVTPNPYTDVDPPDEESVWFIRENYTDGKLSGDLCFQMYVDHIITILDQSTDTAQNLNDLYLSLALTHTFEQANGYDELTVTSVQITIERLHPIRANTEFTT